MATYDPYSLDNLRPLGFYEISRKIFTAILTRRIYNFWEKHGLLDENHHAFRRRHSTLQAIIRLLNPTEDATEHGIPQREMHWICGVHLILFHIASFDLVCDKLGCR